MKRMGAVVVPEPVDDLPPMFRRLQALENRVPGSLYVNMLATCPAFRRRGVATALLAEARAAGGPPPRGLSLIVADDNRDARRLCRAFGVANVAEEPSSPRGGRRRAGPGCRWRSSMKVAPSKRRPRALHSVSAGSSLPVRGSHPGGLTYS